MVETKNILIGVAVVAAILFLVYIFYSNSNRKCKTCLDAHKQSGDNYVWLNVLGHGDVLKIEFEEPVGSGKWVPYNDKWWETHCRVVDHRPENLVNAHVDAFINPGRFARLMFTFHDGTKMEPTVEFYQLEADYFRKNSVC